MKINKCDWCGSLNALENSIPFNTRNTLSMYVKGREDNDRIYIPILMYKRDSLCSATYHEMNYCHICIDCLARELNKIIADRDIEGGM